MEIDQLGRLRDIREACSLIESYMARVSSEDFFEDTEKQDPLLGCIENIGEATAQISEATRAQLPRYLPANSRHAQYRGSRLRSCGCCSRLENNTEKYADSWSHCLISFGKA